MHAIGIHVESLEVNVEVKQKADGRGRKEQKKIHLSLSFKD